MGDDQMTAPATPAATKLPVADKLWLHVLIGLAFGIIVGVIMGPDLALIERELALTTASWLALPGKLFLQLILFAVVPLIISSVSLAIAGGQDVSAIQKLGGSVVIYFIVTTAVAATIGIVITTIFNPGSFIDRSAIDMDAAAAISTGFGNGGTVPEQIVAMFPRNLFGSIVAGNYLQVVIAAAIFGLALLAIPGIQSRPLIDLLTSIQHATIRIVTWLMKFAPIAVFGLIASQLTSIGFSALVALSAYIGTFLVVLLLLFSFYMVLVTVLARRNPITFMKNMREPLVIAFSTSSSSATMPVTLRCADEKMHIHPTVRRLVIPLGATINMDGTAAYQAVVVVFMTQLFGIHLGVPELITLVALSIGASIGAPGIPGGVLAKLIGILISIGIPEAGIALILSVDRILDMARTTVNVTGDMVTASVLERFLGFKKNNADEASTLSETAPEGPA